MAYHGYIDLIIRYCIAFNKIYSRPAKILEVGIDKGITPFAIMNNLNFLGLPMNYVGVDILIQPHVIEYFKDYMTIKHEKTNIKLFEKNSLEILPEFSKNNIKFDIILLDGDHNYETVSKECNFLKSLYHENSLFIFDDYNGKYSYEDMFYGKRKEYKEKEMIVKTKEKAGIKEPIDKFILSENLTLFSLYKENSPICAKTKKNSIIKFNTDQKEGKNDD